MLEELYRGETMECEIKTKLKAWIRSEYTGDLLTFPFMQENKEVDNENRKRNEENKLIRESNAKNNEHKPTKQLLKYEYPAAPNDKCIVQCFNCGKKCKFNMNKKYD
jgi:hypothetical protein